MALKKWKHGDSVKTLFSRSLIYNLQNKNLGVLGRVCVCVCVLKINICIAYNVHMSNCSIFNFLVVDVLFDM